MKQFEWSLRLKGFPVNEAKKTQAIIDGFTQADYANYLSKQLQAIVAFHLEHTPFYNTLCQGIDTKDWSALPVLTKANLQQPLANRLSDKYTVKTVHKHKTSGSSGTPFEFAKDNFAHAMTWVTFMQRYSWFNIDLNTSKQARFYGIPLDTNGYYKERLKDCLGNRFRFSVFDLSDAALNKVLHKFKRTKFNYINGYTSAIVQFAKFLKRNNIVLKDVCPTLTVCIVTSEMLFDDDKKLLETQFNIPIVNEYGAAELGLIAFEDQDDNWIVNTNHLYVEILDNNNQPVPYGQPGKIVVTDLYNRAHPFIRYELGDLGQLSIKSTLQRPILDALTGRTSDFITLPSGKIAAGLTFYYVTKTVMTKDANVKEFIVEQIKEDTFKIDYVATEALSKTQQKAVQLAVDKYLEPNLNLIFEQKTILEREVSGKLKQFRSGL
ncbi:phenylacetate--CoA ligase family protein [Olleya marilimosa]|uniref:Phenylacetate--CoA ligase family protein n=1 Tax=Olleya marilimosa TaxID=272164 RepID=A0ABR8LYR8_9FLAO|nr:phenylacetate--CoA ligase family protein [Olleya marilimosa]MBD3863157.1 phenylacetate--CoA ligase family protein [Olleya marilimosa]MBD3890655.1 phenylacetate--CoA ligase family protein [Olleya marilimosa]